MYKRQVFRRLSGDRLDKIRKAFYLTHIGGSVDVNPRLEQFLHILVPAAVPASLVGVGKIVQRQQLRLSAQGGIQVELPWVYWGDLLQPLQQGQGFSRGFGVYHSHKMCIRDSITNHLFTFMFCVSVLR